MKFASCIHARIVSWYDKERMKQIEGAMVNYKFHTQSVKSNGHAQRQMRAESKYLNLTNILICYSKTEIY